MPLRIALPGADVEAVDWTQPFARQRQRRATADLGKNSRKQVCGCGGVEHLAAWLIDERLRQRKAHPVARGNPAAVIRSRHAIEPRLHREKIADRDVVDARVRRSGKIGLQDRRDLLIRPGEQALADGDTDQRRNDRFRSGFDIGRFRRRMATEPSFSEHASVASDDHSLQGPHRRIVRRLIETRAKPGPCVGRALGNRLPGCGKRQAEEKQKGKNSDHAAQDRVSPRYVRVATALFTRLCCRVRPAPFRETAARKRQSAPQPQQARLPVWSSGADMTGRGKIPNLAGRSALRITPKIGIDFRKGLCADSKR